MKFHSVSFGERGVAIHVTSFLNYVMVFEFLYSSLVLVLTYKKIRIAWSKSLIQEWNS